MTTVRNLRRIPSLSALLLTVVVMASSPAALASPSVAATVRTHGTCSGPSRWALKINVATSAPLQISFTVSGSAAGQRWNVFMSDNGHGVFAGSRTASSQGTFVVYRKVKDLPGVDKLSVAANNADTGETCQARATV